MSFARYLVLAHDNIQCDMIEDDIPDKVNMRPHKCRLIFSLNIPDLVEGG